MTKYECSKCGRKFETEEGLNTHKEHCRKKTTFPHKVGIIAIILAGLFVFALIFNDFGSSDIYYKPDTTIDYEFERASEEWDNYRQLLNNDGEKLRNIRACENIDTIDELNDCIAELSPRLSIYHSHLLQAKGFLMENCNLISNCLEIQEQIDDSITYVVSTQYKMDIVINDINDYNAKQEAIRDLIKIAALNI